MTRAGTSACKRWRRNRCKSWRRAHAFGTSAGAASAVSNRICGNTAPHRPEQLQGLPPLAAGSAGADSSAERNSARLKPALRHGTQKLTGLLPPTALLLNFFFREFTYSLQFDNYL